MIKIEVTQAASRDEIGIYPYKFDEIVIGDNYSCDLILSNTGIDNEAIKLTVVKQDLILETLSFNQFVVLNGKKMSGHLKLRPNDRIQLGESALKVIEFSQNKTEDDFPYEKYEKILLNDGPQKELVIAIENELKKLS